MLLVVDDTPRIARVGVVALQGPVTSQNTPLPSGQSPPARAQTNSCRGCPADHSLAVVETAWMARAYAIPATSSPAYSSSSPSRLGFIAWDTGP